MLRTCHTVCSLVSTPQSSRERVTCCCVRPATNRPAAQGWCIRQVVHIAQHVHTYDRTDKQKQLSLTARIMVDSLCTSSFASCLRLYSTKKASHVMHKLFLLRSKHLLFLSFVGHFGYCIHHVKMFHHCTDEVPSLWEKNARISQQFQR